MKGIYMRCLKLILLVWIACVSTFHGILFSLSNNGDLPQPPKVVRAHVSPKVTPRPRFLLNITDNSDSLRNFSSKEQLVRKTYLRLRQHKVNPIDYPFILEGNNAVCNKTWSPFLLLVVPSIPGQFKTREAIRKTYGSFAEGSIFNTGLKKKLNVSVGLLFVLGQAETQKQATLVKNEHKIYGDILQADFQDSYYNLTVKVLVSMKWISKRCKDVKYMLKIDTDVFVNVPYLVEFLQNQTTFQKGNIYGKIHVDHNVLREGRWAVSVEQFPPSVYPNYAAGNAYVISGNIIPLMFYYAEYIPYLSIEDAFITGCLGGMVGAKKFTVTGFTWWDVKAPKPCAFYEERKFSANRVTISKMYKYWAAYIEPEMFCVTYRDIFQHKSLRYVLDTISNKNLDAHHLYREEQPTTQKY